MSSTLPGADIRGFYRALGVQLPEWSGVEASARCFADPAAHAHGDRDPSCSVNVETGVWHCVQLAAPLYEGLSSAYGRGGRERPGPRLPPLRRAVCAGLLEPAVPRRRFLGWTW
jgi:hypothetical protein